ncbi:hypothetical protein [Mesorhizobium sp. L103C131B0]|uniref:hypothetical protein n=1 Tax=Mesorhizobium sp. L103C131B0 TaxID=1287089 RepID=UPI0012DBFDD2|nr:hypothetical protein [Mesorhizobium sp. L103C131B0]
MLPAEVVAARPDCRPRPEFAMFCEKEFYWLRFSKTEHVVGVELWFCTTSTQELVFAEIEQAYGVPPDLTVRSDGLQAYLKEKVHNGCTFDELGLSLSIWNDSLLDADRKAQEELEKSTVPKF